MVKPIQKDKSRTFIQSIFVGLIALVVVLLVSWFSIGFVTYKSIKAQKEQISDALESIARVAAKLVDGDKHEQIRNGGSHTTDLYKEAIEPLLDVHQSLPRIAYLYTFFVENDDIYFVLDTSNYIIGSLYPLSPSYVMKPYVSNSDKTKLLELLRSAKQGSIASKDVDKDAYGSFLSAYAPIRNTSGKVVGIVGVDMDISHLILLQGQLIAVGMKAGFIAFLLSLLTGIVAARAYKQLIASKQALQEEKLVAENATKAKGEFLAIMSHEIRTPLNGIIGCIELLKGTKLDDSQKEYMHAIASCSKSLLNLLNDILDISFTTHKSSVLENIPLRKFLEEICSPYKQLGKEKGVNIEIHLPKELEYIKSDTVRLRQILTNLIGNAFKFTEHGKVAIKISKMEADLHFSIEDTGIGIALEQQEEIFKPFVQEDTSIRRKFGGTGLGLAIAQSLARTIGGDLQLKMSKPGKTEFVAKVPYVSGVKILPEALNIHLPKHLNILIVEDSQINVMVLSRLLAKLNYQTTAVENGEQCLDLIISKQQSFDIIFMDIQMPGLDGWEVCRQLRKAGVTSKIIAATADAEPGAEQMSKEVGMDAHITKPYSLIILKKVIQEVTQ